MCRSFALPLRLVFVEFCFAVNRARLTQTLRRAFLVLLCARCRSTRTTTLSSSRSRRSWIWRGSSKPLSTPRLWQQSANSSQFVCGRVRAARRAWRASERGGRERSASSCLFLLKYLKCWECHWRRKELRLTVCFFCRFAALRSLQRKD